MNELQIFNNPSFGEIRTLIEGDKVLFCASDIAKALGYKYPNDAVNQHCRATVKRRTPISGKMQDINFILEGDVYRLIVRSKLPAAQEFETWLFDVVLPSIRKNGFYAMAGSLEKLLADPKNAIKIFTALDEEREKRIEAEKKADYVDMVLQSTDAVTTSQIAADYGLSAQHLNKVLHKNGLQYKVNDQWLLYQKYKNKGYTKSETITFDKSDGTQGVKMCTKWTQKGRLKIHEILTKCGYVPNPDHVLLPLLNQ